MRETAGRGGAPRRSESRHGALVRTSRRHSRSVGGRGEKPSAGTSLELLAQLAALGEVDQHRVRQKRLGSPVGCPLELLVAPRHVIDDVLHPKERLLTIPHKWFPFPGMSGMSATRCPVLRQSPYQRPGSKPLAAPNLAEIRTLEKKSKFSEAPMTIGRL